MIKELYEHSCDRCLVTSVAKQREDLSGWVRLLKVNTQIFHLCPDCWKAFKGWIKVEQGRKP